MSGNNEFGPVTPANEIPTGVLAPTGSSMNVNGVFYFPTQHVEYTGTGGGDYLIIVCDTMKFTGNSSVNSNYATSPAAPL